MNAPSSSRQQAIRSLIERFIAERLATKLESLSADDPKRATLLAQYAPDVWLEDAARRAGPCARSCRSLACDVFGCAGRALL